MNSANNTGDNDIGTDGPSSVSRSGRVRKKNSLLAVYDSTDVVDKKKRRTSKLVKNAKMGKRQVAKRDFHDYNSSSGIVSDSDSLDMLNHHYEGEVPDIGGEEVIDESMDGSSMRHKFYNSNVRLKSQAESTYMMEKTFKQRKMTGQAVGPRMKATRKDKGSPRVTAYMLWAKDQRANFAQKYPHMDFSSLSKKLSDLWATVPQNQKRMWKTKAAKIMRKKANVAENIKNSAGPSVNLPRKSLPSLKQHKGMKNTTSEEVYLPKRPPGRHSKKFLAPPPVVQIATASHSKSQTHNHTSASSGHYKKPKRPSNKNVSKNTYVAATNNFKPRLVAVAANVKPLFDPNTYEFKVDCGTDTLDVAAHLSLLGESMKKLGSKMQQMQDQSVNDSLSSLLDSLLCAVGPLLCLNRQVPELNCIPEGQLKRILSNVDYIMPGL